MPAERSRDTESDSRRRGRAPSKGGSSRDDRREPGPDLAGPEKWGRIARGGAGRMDSPAIGTEAFDDFPSKRPRPPRKRKGDRDESEAPPVGADPVESGAAAEVEPVAERTPPAKPTRNLPGADDLERQAAKAVRRSRGPRLRERRPLGSRPQRVEDPAVVLPRLVGPERAKSLLRKLKSAGSAFEAERFGDARTLLQTVVHEAPDLADGRELLGLTHYRLGRWKEAIDQLEAFRELSHSTEQHPVLMDCHRALGRWRDVDVLWSELGEVSPSGELMTEGRIVVAGGQADQGDVSAAIRTLESGWKLPKRPSGHHLRRAYALADLYDRAGKAARARELFKWISGHDPHFADVRSRVKALS
jgi:tetratricopeptide repeat protein